jgi:hypothetical protein
VLVTVILGANGLELVGGASDTGPLGVDTPLVAGWPRT